MNPPAFHAQRGSALTVAILILLLLTLAIFLAMPAMLGEQRVSGNDVRAKIAQHVAEAGLSHGREFLRANRLALLPEPGQPTDPTQWVACGATDTAFPCGAVEPDVANSALRSNHYRYHGGADDRSITFAPGRMYDGTGDDAGNFNASYDVGILLCRLNTTNGCTRTFNTATGTTMYTLVSRGSVTGEGTTATVSETIGTYRLINLSNNFPPIMAAGTITGLGNSTIVGNPNAGGFGVPLSIWARNDFVGSGGSWQTCQLDEYLRSSLGNVLMEGKGKNVPTCVDCTCDGNEVSHGNPSPTEGIDILDSTDTDAGKVFAGSPYFYPCDMFEYVLGTKARTDEDADGICETIKDTEGVIPMPDVEEWLTDNAQIKTCAEVKALGSGAAGVIWIKSPCLGTDMLTGRIGSPDNPVIVVMDGDLKLHTNVEFFGIIFLRYTGDEFDTCIADGTGCPEIDGGGGGAKVYGSIVLEGGGKVNGQIDLVYLPQLITAFNTSPANNNFAGLPGSWSDRVAY